MDDECRCELCVWYPPAPEPIPSITGNLESDIPMTQRYDPPERPTTHRVDIVMNDGEVGSIHMDGRDVGQWALNAVVFLQPGRGPKVVLELAPEALGIRSDSADVEMGTETYGLLRQLGWTPPMAPKVPVAQSGMDVQESSHGGTPTEPGAPETVS